MGVGRQLPQQVLLTPTASQRAVDADQAIGSTGLCAHQAVTRRKQFALGIQHREKVAGTGAEARACQLGCLAGRSCSAEQQLDLLLRTGVADQRAFGVLKRCQK